MTEQPPWTGGLVDRRGPDLLDAYYRLIPVIVMPSMKYF